MRTFSFIPSVIIALCIMQGVNSGVCCITTSSKLDSGNLSIKTNTFQHGVQDLNESAETVDETEILSRCSPFRSADNKQSSGTFTVLSSWNGPKTSAITNGLPLGFTTPLRIWVVLNTCCFWNRINLKVGMSCGWIGTYEVTPSEPSPKFHPRGKTLSHFQSVNNQLSVI